MPSKLPDKISCDSLQSFQQELSALSDALSVTETEETWDRIERALIRFTAVVKGGGFKYDKELIDGMKALAKPINSAMNSERTRLSAAALDCLSAIAPRLALTFDALVPHFTPHILRLSNRTNKVYVTRSQASMALIISYCHIPSLIHHLLVACKDSKIVTGRAAAAEGIMRALNKWDWTQKEMKAKVGDVEEVIRLTGRDKDAGIRQTSRKVFEAYKLLFPERVEAFIAPLTPVMRKYLDIAHADRGRSVAKLNFSSSTSSSIKSTAMTLQPRSASSHAEKKAPKAHPRPRAVAPEHSMPPPSQPTSHARHASHASRPQSRTRNDDSAPHERQRVLSNASSTFSVKSAPSKSHPIMGHKPPTRLASSQSRANPPLSSGPPRRVPRVISMESHPENLPDLFAVARKAATRPDPALGAPVVSPEKPRNGQEPTSNALGIAFPSTDSGNGLPVERKGPQRIPKAARLPPQTVDPPELSSKASLPTAETESRAEATPVADHITPGTDDSKELKTAVQKSIQSASEASKSSKDSVSKRETKPAAFRRAVITKEASLAKTKDGFVPRRGGLTQPTLSQLSKQKPPIVANGKARVMNGLKAKRPAIAPNVRKVSSSAKTVRDVTAKSPIVPTCTSPVNEAESKAHLIPLPTSPEPMPTDKTETAQPIADAAIVDSSEPPVMELAESGASEICELVPVARAETPDLQEPAGRAMETGLDLSEEDVPSTESTPVPQTPPFPSTDDDESGADELEDIEFTAGPVYDPSGMPIKTPRKTVAATTTEKTLPDRSPLKEVTLNE